MTATHLRMTRYYLGYARQHKDDWQALDGAQFAQIRRGWAVASEGCAGLTADERATLIFGYLNALDGYLERCGLWAELLAWNQRALAAARSISNEALVGGLLNDIGCHLAGDLGTAGATLNNLAAVSSAQGDPATAVDYYERALAVRRQIEDVAGQARTLFNLGLLCADLDDLGRAEIALAEAKMLEEQYDLPQLARDRKALAEVRRRFEEVNVSAKEAGP